MVIVAALIAGAGTMLIGILVGWSACQTTYDRMLKEAERR